MKLKDNIYYWNLSLKNLEPLLDDYYIFDNLIIKDKDLLEKADNLRELIITYCVLLEKEQDASETAEIIFKDIYKILTSVNNIQYHEFVAFWKVLDISYSVFDKLKKQNIILKKILKKYCEKRRQFYDNLGYSNVTIQALYDVGTSRKKGNAANIKIETLIKSNFNHPVQISRMNELGRSNVAYFFADRGGKSLFKQCLEKYNIKYEFGDTHQGKRCDIILIIQDHVFLIEAKHIKEGGGAQDKQVAEVIEFIKYSEDNKNIHYIAFMDGVYFNKFSGELKSNKVKRQKQDIELYLANNKSNYYLNTFGLIKLFKDLSDLPNILKWADD